MDPHYIIFVRVYVCTFVFPLGIKLKAHSAEIWIWFLNPFTPTPPQWAIRLPTPQHTNTLTMQYTVPVYQL